MSKSFGAFFIIAFVTGIFGFMPDGMMPVAVAGVARILFPVFLGLGLIAFLVVYVAGVVCRSPTAS
jgi:uncharacterized membrane protein YtjA (UPF0391 family)